MLETAHSEVASRFPRNCSLSQPVSIFQGLETAKKSLRRLLTGQRVELPFRSPFRSVPFRSACGGDGVLDPDFTLYLLTQLRARAPE